MILKTKLCHSCGCCDDSWTCEQMNQRVTDQYFKKKTLKPYHLPGNICYYYNTWVTGVYMAYMCDINSGGKASQIEWFKSNLRSFGYFECSAVPQFQKYLAYKSWFGAFGPDCHLTPKKGHLQITEVAFRS